LDLRANIFEAEDPAVGKAEVWIDGEEDALGVADGVGRRMPGSRKARRDVLLKGLAESISEFRRGLPSGHAGRVIVLALRTVGTSSSSISSFISGREQTICVEH
jgi:hypothetical protein